jgi:hypothetical protein
MSTMTDYDETGESPWTILCKSCGLCCTGHLFIWSKLRSSEMDSAEALGLNVFRSDPRQRGFSQPCPLWEGQCTIYASPHYPRFCRTYKCKLLKQVLDETTSLPEALSVIEQAKGMILELEALLPASQNPNFRERLVARLEQLKEHRDPENSEAEFRLKASALLIFYRQKFGVTDLVETPEEE